jgi:hypothetical protein
MLPSLLGEFSLEGAEVTEIQVKVQPTMLRCNKIQGISVPPSARRRRPDLEQLATDLPEDSPLKEALGRLVRNSR